DILSRLYRYHLSQGGSALPQDLNSVQNIMTLKEFSGDTLRDIITSVLEKYQDVNPIQYNDVISRMFNTRLENPKGLAKNVIKMMQAFRNKPEDGKLKLGSMLKVVDIDIINFLWGKLIGMSDLRDVEKELSELEFQIQPGKGADSITRQLLGENVAKMQGEFSAKYRYNEGKNKISLHFEVSKKKAHGVAGFNMGVCVAPDRQLWNNPDFMNLIIWNEEGIALGGMHIFIIEDAGKKYVTLPGINPSTNLMTKVNADDIFNNLMTYALKLNTALGYDGVLIPTSSSIHSNRSEVQRVISSRRYESKTLTTTHPFSYSPEYSFNMAYVVTEVATVAKETHQYAMESGDDTVVKNPTLDQSQNGGIDLTPDRLNMDVNADGRIKFNVDPAMLQKLQDMPGFSPVILRVSPIASVRNFLGLNDGIQPVR
ncbi:MAG: hypothetical protein WCI27_07855, partial [Candidatus Omnitrophota bacterium]